MRGDRCELCGEPTYHDMTWPGRKYLWHVCIENGCDDRLAKAVGAYGDREHGRWFHSDVASGRCMSFDWWYQPHNEPICGRIDEEAEKLQRIWRPRGGTIIHADIPTPHGANCQTISYLPNTPTTACVVCGKLRATPHTFHTEDGYTKAHLCCETEDQPGCCREITRVWRMVEPKPDAGTQEGLATVVCRVAREHGFVHEFAAMLGYQIGPAQPLVEAEKQRDRENTERMKEVAQQMAVPAMVAAQNEAVLKMVELWSMQLLEKVETAEGKPDAIIGGQMVEHKTSGPSVPQDWKAELPRPALQLRPYRGLLFYPGPAYPGPASEEIPADGPRYRCTRCEAVGPRSDGSWRCEGTGWSHACVDRHPQEGHFPSTPVCSGCGRPVQAAAPARDGHWYCETCVGFKTLMADTTARIERRQEEREAARKAAPPLAPGRPYRLMGDFYGPKV